MSYLENVPSDLYNAIVSYLNYKSLIKSELSTNYQNILQLKYPGYYHIINTIKRENILYKHYSWEEAFELIDRIENVTSRIINYVEVRRIEEQNETGNITLVTSKIERYNMRSPDPEEIMENLIMCFNFEETPDITAAYTISSTYKNHKYYKFLKLVPPIKKINQILLPLYDETEFYKKNIIKKFKYLEELEGVDRIIQAKLLKEDYDISLLLAFFMVLDDPVKNSKLKEILLNIDFYKLHRDILTGEITLKLMMIHNHIVEYLNE